MIHKLNEGLVSHLAAGEVVERPSSIIRECIDNSIDALSNKISIETVESGINSIIIDDDGCGIEKNDLNHIALAHSTSKISTINDIYNIRTMGFRGEALFSISSVGNLKIESNGYGIEIRDFKRSEIFKSTKINGTRITLTSLFEKQPVRKAFLSTLTSENKRNRDLIEEKALAFPNIEFSLKNNDKELLLYKNESQIDRIEHFLNDDINSRIKFVEKTEQDFSISLYYKENAARKDRRKIKIYVNKRAVSDAYLMSAILYAFSKITPGGTFPECIIFINNDYSLTDFNVHPQKRECRLRNAHDIHSTIAHIFEGVENVFSPRDAINFEDNRDTSFTNETEPKLNAIKNNIKINKNDISEDFPINTSSSILNSNTYIRKPLDESLEENCFNFDSDENKIHFKYIGQLWNLFLLYTIDDTLYIMDQHAAAERLLFESLKSKSSIQDLLFPLTIELEKEQSLSLEKNLHLFSEKGIILEKENNGLWTLKAIPAISRNSEREIIELVKNANDEEIEEKLYAIIACHNSIRKGDFVPTPDAIDLIERALKLPSLTCPHGRTFVTKIEKSALESLVMRD